jgi:hypothetical protein
MEVTQLTAVVKGNQTKLFGIADGQVVRYDWLTGAWLVYKKTDK